MARKVKIRDLRSGRIKSIDARYAKTLILLKKAELYIEPEKTYSNKEKTSYKKTEMKSKSRTAKEEPVVPDVVVAKEEPVVPDVVVAKEEPIVPDVVVAEEVVVVAETDVKQVDFGAMMDSVGEISDKKVKSTKRGRRSKKEKIEIDE